jgi:UDPglucose 6-dehydrogenase
VYDPKVKAEQIYTDINYLNSRSKATNEKLLEVVKDPYEACKDAHAIAILTEWDEFITYDWQKIYDNMNKPAFVFDGRMILDGKILEAIGFKYYVIGAE